MINVDTDMIIPKQYLKTIKRTGLGGLFPEALQGRRQRRSDFVLNKPAYQGNLVAGDNFGCGSSREHAPGADGFRYPLRDLDLVRHIFYNNCFKNGVLPIESPEDLEKLFDDAERQRDPLGRS